MIKRQQGLNGCQTTILRNNKQHAPTHTRQLTRPPPTRPPKRISKARTHLRVCPALVALPRAGLAVEPWVRRRGADVGGSRVWRARRRRRVDPWRRLHNGRLPWRGRDRRALLHGHLVVRRAGGHLPTKAITWCHPLATSQRVHRVARTLAKRLVCRTTGH